MKCANKRTFNCLRIDGCGVLATTVLAGMISQAYAQQAPATPETQTITVTGFRSSLTKAAEAKRDNISFTDSIFAEDMGKFPDGNIAESLQRISGITISREINGDGLNVQIRGLGTNFTKVLLNGAPIAVASSGRTDAQNTNREVDLDMLPTELFSRLTVTKSPTADLLEGGAAGVVDMRTARPFDRRGTRYSVSLEGVNNSVVDKWGHRGSALASTTSGDTFGILGGIAWSHQNVRTKGFETIGWTNANLSATQSSSSTRNNTGGGNWTIPGTVPANAGSGLTTGDTINEAYLLAKNPGLSITQIDNALIPRLGRPMEETGTRDRYSGVLSVEYRPSSAMQFYVDALAGKKNNNLTRLDMNWVGRNGSMVPINMQVDRSDCANGCVVTKGTFTNAQYFLEYRPHNEDVELWGVNPGMTWQLNDKLLLDAQANQTKSKFHRESPSVVVITPASSGVTVNYDNTAGGIPIIASNINLNDPSKFGWPGGRVNIQDEYRDTDTKGLRGNLTWGDKGFNLKGGFAYDDISRRVLPKDGSALWQNAICGNNPSPNLNYQTQPACNGLNAPGSAAALYPGYGTGYTAGATGTPQYLGSLIPNSALVNYLKPSSAGFVTVDWDKLAADSKYPVYHDQAIEVSGANTGANNGFIREKTSGLYGEVNGDADLLGNRLRYNAGVRYVQTEQEVGGFVSIPDPRNVSTLLSGGRYPNITNLVILESKYHNTLPSATFAYNLGKDMILRGAYSKTMTRANPDQIRPSVNFTSPSADTGTIGNPDLKPFMSNNVDLGLEFYSGREGSLALTGFKKSIEGFTINQNITMPFTDLAIYGINYDNLTPTQQAAINQRGGPNTASVVMTRQINSPYKLNINGVELNWVQPLDRLLPFKGLGFTASLMKVHQSSSDPSVVALGVPKDAYNLTLYYENRGVTFRISQAFNKGSQQSTLNQNGITNAALFSDDYKQVDLSLSVDLDAWFDVKGQPQLAFNVNNLTNATQRSYYQFPNATFTQYNPARSYTMGLRMKF
ncbi:MAG: TonB-dependent receptor [Burkholderiales bacterium]|nr:TonB-dependent receptor [Burkholderiales bacterium]